MRLRDRELNRVVDPYRSTEYDPFCGVARSSFDEPPSVPDALRRDQDPFGVPAVEDVAKALSLLADEHVGRNAHLVEEHLGRVVVQHRAAWIDPDRAPGVTQIDQEHGQPRGGSIRSRVAVRASRSIKSDWSAREVQIF